MANKAVTIEDNRFTPASVTISRGDTVTWSHNGLNTHNVTSDDGRFTSSGDLGNGDQYSQTFNNAGDYPYHCTHHPGTMKGKITVT